MKKKKQALDDTIGGNLNKSRSKMKHKLKLPPFYNYKEEGTDSGYETIQDFILSWTLRCSVEENSLINKKLHIYSKKILLSMIFGYNDENWEYRLKEINERIEIKSVRTKRQWNLIDLLAEVEIDINGKKTNFVLNIENKWYTSIRKGQLEKSKLYVEEKYSDSDWNIINLVVFYDSVKLNTEIQDFCKTNNYKVLVIEDLYELAEMNENELTDNYLFDEYWFRF